MCPYSTTPILQDFLYRRNSVLVLPFLGRGKKFLSSSYHPESNCRPQVLFNVNWRSFSRIQRPRCDGDHRPQTRAEDRNDWGNTYKNLWPGQVQITFNFPYSHFRSYFICTLNMRNYSLKRPIPVAARSKAWVCGRSPAGIVGSNPTGGMDACLL